VKSNRYCEIIFKWLLYRCYSWTHRRTNWISKWTQIENMKS